jgi:hypothetical protein
MPLYYFDIHDGDGCAPDEEGVELGGLRDAQTEAVRSLGDLASESDIFPHLMRIEVIDAQRKPVMTVSLTVEIKGLSS